MLVIGVFRDFFANFGGVLDFMNSTHTLSLGGFGSISFTPLTIFGAGIGSVLLITFALHLVHLLNVVFS